MKKNEGFGNGRGKFAIMRVLVILMAVAGCFCGCGEKKEKTADISVVVRIDLGVSTASGVIYERTEDALIIVTAGHVLEEMVSQKMASAEDSSARVAVAELFSGETSVGELPVKVSDVFLSQTSETAFLAIPSKEIPPEIWENCQAAPRNQELFDGLREGETMFLSGYSADGELLEITGELLYSWIYARDFEQYMMLVDGESFPGMSGGGVFDTDGNLAGILCGVNEAGESAAVPLSIIVAEYMQAYPGTVS